MRVVLFLRCYRKFSGGHLKIWHYFNHVLASPLFTPRIWFSSQTNWDNDNPWQNSRDFVVTNEHPIRPDVIFVGGGNWRYIRQYPGANEGLPIINLVQHVRHADEGNRRFEFLSRPAIRLCVSPEVAEAVEAAGSEGPTIMIPNGLDVPIAGTSAWGERPVDLFIAGLKQPQLALNAAEALATPGRVIETLVEHVSRDAFLDAMRRARVTLLLPNPQEGFYLPALEGMAVGTVVVCPDCVGNRSFCLPGVNAFRPSYRFDDLVGAAEAALGLPESEASALIANANETARQHGLETERDAFHAVLHNIDALWASTSAGRRTDAVVDAVATRQRRGRRAKSSP
jgi:hypothetical protein